MKQNEQQEKPLSIAQRLLAKKKLTQDNYYGRPKELRTAEGRRLHKLGAEIIKEDINARETHS